MSQGPILIRTDGSTEGAIEQMGAETPSARRPTLIETDERHAEPIAVEWNPAELEMAAPASSFGSLTAIALGLGTLFAGFLISSAVSYVTNAFRVNGGVGALTGVVAGIGIALVAWGAWREIRGYLALAKWEDNRHAVADNAPVEPAKQIALRWLRSISDARLDVPAVNERIAAASDCREIRSVLEKQVLLVLDERAEQAIKAATYQIFITTGMTPSAKFEGTIFLVRSLRLIREVAGAYGLRPSTLGAAMLLRRIFFGAAMVSGTDVAVTNLAQMLLSNEWAAKFAGEVGGAMVASQRMNRLGRAAIATCRPWPVSSS
jgi:putative membrane protein